MRTKVKAVVLNALVFPGIGQLVLKRRWRGWLYIATALGCLIAFFSVAYSQTATLLAEPAILDNAVNNIQILKEEIVHRLSEGKHAWVALVIPLFILVWIIALLDAILTRTTELAAE